MRRKVKVGIPLNINAGNCSPYLESGYVANFFEEENWKEFSMQPSKDLIDEDSSLMAPLGTSKPQAFSRHGMIS